MGSESQVYADGLSQMLTLSRALIFSIRYISTYMRHNESAFHIYPEELKTLTKRIVPLCMTFATYTFLHRRIIFVRIVDLMSLLYQVRSEQEASLAAKAVVRRWREVDVMVPTLARLVLPDKHERANFSPILKNEGGFEEKCGNHDNQYVQDDKVTREEDNQ